MEVPRDADRRDTDRRRAALVIGGGISGLAAAIRIRALDPSVTVTIIEATAELGGKIAGEMVDGCVIDGGADVCIGEKLRTTHLFAALNLDARAIRANPDGLPTYELLDGRLQRMPTTFHGELLTFPTGVREIVSVACSNLAGVAVLPSVAAVAIERDGSNWRVRCSDGTDLTSDVVIVTTPATASAALFAGIAPDSASRLGELEYPSTTTVTMAWRVTDVPRPLDATGYLVADPAARVSACTWTSAKNPAHSPLDVALLRCFIRDETGDPAALMRREVAAVLGITAPPILTRVYRWPSAIPLYTSTHNETVRELSRQLIANPGLFVAGSAFHGVGIPDCIHSGERAATDAVSYLLSRQTEEAA